MTWGHHAHGGTSRDGIATSFSAMVLACSATIPATWRRRWSECENLMERRGGREAEDLRRFVFRSLLAPMRQRGRCREGLVWDGGAVRFCWGREGGAEMERKRVLWHTLFGGFFLIYFVNLWRGILVFKELRWSMPYKQFVKCL